MNETIKVYTPEQVAEITQLNLATIYRHIKSGALKGVKLGSSIRIKQEDLDKYLQGGN